MIDQAPLVSLVCPVYSEEQCLREFHARAVAAVEAAAPDVRYEFVYVDDGSTDSSPQILRELAASDPAVRVLTFSRNFGHQMAITAGIDNAAGDAVVLIDTDLQDPPEVIPEMIRRWRDGNEVVYGVRSNRDGESRFKLWTARVFYRFLNRLSDIDLPLDSGDFRLLDRKVVDQLQTLRERNRYVRGLVAWVGFNQCAVEYERDRRHAGTSKYTLGKMVRLAVDALTSFSEKPLRLALKLGLLMTVLACAGVAWIVGGKILTPDGSVPGFASLMIVVLLLGGIQLLCVGLLGEYVARIYLESKQRPLYVVAGKVNFGPPWEVSLAEAEGPATGEIQLDQHR